MTAPYNPTLAAAAASPLAPTTYDIAWSLVVVLAIGLLIAGLWFLLREKYSPLTTVLWALIMLVLPIIGPTFFLLYRGRKDA